jgi:hypothetical protein
MKKWVFLIILVGPCSWGQTAPSPAERAHFDVEALTDAELAVICGDRSEEWFAVVQQGVNVDILSLPSSANQILQKVIQEGGPRIPHPTHEICENLENDPVMKILDQFVIQQNNR